MDEHVNYLFIKTSLLISFDSSRIRLFFYEPINYKIVNDVPIIGAKELSG